MKKEFLKNFQVNGQPLPDVVIDAIMQEKAICGRANGVADGGSQQSMTQWKPPWMRFRLWQTNTPTRLKIP